MRMSNQFHTRHIGCEGRARSRAMFPGTTLVETERETNLWHISPIDYMNPSRRKDSITAIKTR
jgi:hypothetical protein